MASSIPADRRFAMTQDSLMIVRLDVKERNGSFFVTSSNLPGLNAYGFGVEAAYESVVRMVKALFRHNSGFEVEVWPATTDGAEFPKMMRLCSEVVVRRKAPPRARAARPERNAFTSLEAVQ